MIKNASYCIRTFEHMKIALPFPPTFLIFFSPNLSLLPLPPHILYLSPLTPLSNFSNLNISHSHSSYPSLPLHAPFTINTYMTYALLLPLLIPISICYSSNFCRNKCNVVQVRYIQVSVRVCMYAPRTLRS